MHAMPPSGVRTAAQDDTTSLENALIFETVRARMFGGGAKPTPVRIGPHRLLRRVGVGGMGEVFLAHDDSLDRPIAIKLLHARLGSERRFAERMQREARALAKLTHPNVVHVYEFGEHEGRFYLAMEYVAGQSLGAWIHEHRPGWRAVLDAYLAAGEGLAAAHAAGLVHRDFKPENVLRGDDGRVCVADFGLARVGTAADTTSEGGSGEGPSTLDERLSAPGTVMGTLGFMPLEQLRGGVVDARSDQFSFALSLYVGLWQRPPFVAASPLEREAALASEPSPPPASEVPRWLWPILRRALAAEPDARWPDLASLLDALRRTPERRRMRRRRAAAALAMPLVVGLGWQLATRTQPELDPCAIDERLLAGTWDGAREQALRDRFAATGSPLAPEMSTRVATALDVWTSRWLAEQRTSCEATRVRGVQSDALLDRRTRCFAGQLDEVATLVEVLAHADAGTLARAGALLGTLPELDECSAAALEADADIRLGPEALAAVDIGYETLARARIALALGEVARARELAGTARAQGEAHGHVPLALESRALLADMLVRGGRLEPALDELRALVVAAERADQHDLAAGFRVALARAAAGDASDLRLERWLIDDAELALDRVGRAGDERRITLEVARARVALHADAPDEAAAAHERAFALVDPLDAMLLASLRLDHAGVLRAKGLLEPARRELELAGVAMRAAWGEQAPELGRVEFDLAVISTALGELDAADLHFARALAIDTRSWGPDSLEVARDRYGMHELGLARGELDAACELVAAVLPVFERELGPMHHETADVLNAAAICRFYAADFVGAIALYERVLSIQREQLGERHGLVGHTLTNLGQARLALGRLDEAEQDFAQALDILTAKLAPDDPELALSLLGRAQVWQARGDDARALPELERALALDGLQGSDLGELHFALARARVAVHGSRELDDARQLAGQALASFEAAGLERLAAPVRAWLSRRPP